MMHALPTLTLSARNKSVAHLSQSVSQSVDRTELVKKSRSERSDLIEQIVKRIKILDGLSCSSYGCYIDSS